MDNILNQFLQNPNEKEYKPLFYRLVSKKDEEDLSKKILSEHIRVYDTLESQLNELVKIKHPGIKWTKSELAEKTLSHLNGMPMKWYGVWVYYPWLQKIVHIVDEEEFIEIRTNRNLYKITPKELAILKTKKIGIIGLSVGQAIALTMATERICGELRLADFDKLELGNMNRLQTGVQELGTAKVVIAARKIAELDPFIKMECWLEGINENNLDDFLSGSGKLDILVEECDSIDIKILSRIKAREMGIPVVMDTNDKGMLDIERFDLEPSREIFHGRLPELESIHTAAVMAKFKKLNIDEKIGYLGRIIGLENVSDEMMASLAQMNRTITGWPQLASAVNLGGAMVTDTCRRMALGKFNKSGRYFIDFGDLIK